MAPTTTLLSGSSTAAVEDFVGVTSDEVLGIAESAENNRGAAIFVNGKAISVDVATTTSSVTLSHLSASLEVRCFDKDGNNIELNNESRFVVRVGDVVRVSVEGFSPGSDVNVAVFSNPTALGTITADDAGSGEQQWRIPNTLSNGNHTLIAAGSLPGLADTVFGLRVVINEKSFVAQVSSSWAVRIFLVLALLVGLMLPATRWRKVSSPTPTN